MLICSEKLSEEPIRWPIDGELDLHLFRPSELGTLVDEYIRACLEKGICEIKIIHGKGTGQLRRSVHKLLDRNPFVTGYSLDSGKSGWGATIATLQTADKKAR